MWGFGVVVAALLLKVSSADDFAWKVINDSTALCNDYTPAGYFVASGRTPEHWVIFLESGGGCYSPTTCNARYFNESVRTKFKSSGSLSVGPLVSYDVFKAKSSVLSAGKTLSDFVSPLVTSMLTFQNTSYFKNGRLSVQGQGILDDNCTNNPIFCNHTRVIIPYCSSDLWLANSPSLSCNISMDLYNQCYANNQSSCVAIGEMYFKNCFLSSSNQLSFVFRGQAIYRGALQQLLDEGLANSSTVTLVGSSAGGVGVVNHAKWTLQLLRNGTRGANLSVIADSSWFINFQDNVYKLFVGLSSNGSVQSGGVFSIITATDTTSVTCKDITHGTPCCFSAFCMLSTPEYYPSKDVSTFMLFGLYDVYLLAQSLIGLNISEVGQKNSGAGLAVKFIQTVSEYGGAMNDSLSVSSRRVARLSYYVTQCFQHIYLVTSTLWGVGNLLGNQAVDISASFGSYQESMSLNTWSSMEVGINKTTIRAALSQWYPNRYTTVVTITDSCSGPHCNSMCPELFALESPSQNTWPASAKTALLATVGAIGIMCVAGKLIFMMWVQLLEFRQDTYLERLLMETDVDEKLKFPECADDHCISVSCLNLSYAVTVKAKKVKDEKEDNTTPVALQALVDDDANEESINGAVDRAFPNSSVTEPTSPNYKTLSESVLKRRKSFLSGKELVREHSKRSLRSQTSYVVQPSPATVQKTTCFGAYTEKEILNGISIYFNPGQLTGIMGPSGCGKTTFLDILTGRRKTGNIKGQVYVNGVPIEQIKDWYIANTGYVLQLATPYYEELTVRENLTLAAQIKLPSTFTLRDKLTRVEQVLAVSELLPFAETVVGKATGPGLSGGQKRRLAIALQLLKLPSVLFLDEPTSGLDATSSYELLTHLNRLADSKRTIILTIHQPRLEIFHLFNYLLLLTDGKIAYHGAPERAYEVFVQALKSRYKEKGFVIPQLEDHNPADIIMDMLGNQKYRTILTDFYNKSNEPNEICRVINKARWKSSSASIDSISSIMSFAIFGAKKVEYHQGGVFNRLAALEARGAKRASFGQMLYLPAIFFAYGVLLGTVYYQSYSPLLVMSGFCVYSVASALFMFPALYLYYQRALEVYAYEHADGVGSPWDIVIQGFIRGVTLGFFPVILCAAILYLLLVNHNSYNFAVFGQVLLINLALNQTWVALLIFIICAFPKIAFRLSPIISSVAGFTSGFFVPREAMPPYYSWLFYINPNYYGFSASANILLNNFNTGCVGSVFECFPSSPQYYLKYFNFDDVNPYLHITILLSFTIIYLLLAVFSNWLRYTTVFYKMRHLFVLMRTRVSKGSTDSEHSVASSISMDRDQEDSLAEKYDVELGDLDMGDVKKLNQQEENQETPVDLNGISAPGPLASSKRMAKVRWKQAAEASLQREEEEVSNTKENADISTSELPKFNRKSIFLRDGEAHVVWRPKRRRSHPALASVVDQIAHQSSSLRERQRTLLHRVRATQEVLREVDIQEEGAVVDEVQPSSVPRSRTLWRQAKDSVVSELQRSKEATKEKIQFHDIVSRYMDRMERSSLDHGNAKVEGATLGRALKVLSRTISGQLTAAGIPRSAPVPIADWKKIVEQAKLTEEGDVGLPRSRPQSLAMDASKTDELRSRETSISDLSTSRTKVTSRTGLKKQVVIMDSEDTTV
eukprot:Em0028g15a